MTKKELIELLIACPVSNFYVISKPDYNGGRENYLFDGHVEDIKLQPFEYVEWQGDKQKLVSDRKQVFTDTYFINNKECNTNFTLETLFNEFYTCNFSS